ncbi:MAG: hypothetical protein ACKO5C_07905 [Ferruginibacter sp.]
MKSPETCRRSFFLLMLGLTYGLAACNADYSPKRKGYFQIALPEKHTYRVFDSAVFPYAFEYPTYARIVPDSSFFGEKPENEFWLNVEFPAYNACLYMSYKRIGDQVVYKRKRVDGSYTDSVGVNQFELLRKDAFKLTNKNDVQATSILDSLVINPQGIHGVYFKVGGNAATARQFFLTDTTHHFFRGALYFNATPNADSLRPVHRFFEQDILHLIQTFRWK